jgi:micrococcal nuclease
MKRTVPLLVVLALLAACGSSMGAAVATPDIEDDAGRSTAGASGDERAESTSRPRPTPRATPRAIPRPTPSPTPKPTPRPTPTPAPTPAFGRAPTGPTQLATVVKITDGDTIRVVVDGAEYPVRYIGIDTPEVHGGVEWMGREASQANAGLVAGRQVVLEKDVSETDRYGRLLRYVWVEEGARLILVNRVLLRRGFAQITTYPPDVKYADTVFLTAQRKARDEGLGLWGAPPPTPVPAAPQPPATSSCEPSYPDICIPIGSADLDCGEIQWRRFSVLWNVANPDPHGFDGNRDGIGCES